MQLVISTLCDPAIGVARLRASGDLVAIRARDLRFDDEELSAFMDAMAGDLPAQDRRRLAERTRGWTAPLRLAAILMPEEGHAAFAETFTAANRPVVDYLTSDVLALLETEVREFVLEVSVLGRMCGPLCDVVVGRTASGAVLAELDRAGLFISADDAGEWYQQHHLFA